MGQRLKFFKLFDCVMNKRSAELCNRNLHNSALLLRKEKVTFGPSQIDSGVQVVKQK